MSFRVHTDNAPAFVINAADSGAAIQGTVPAFSGNPAIYGLVPIGIGVRGDTGTGTGVMGTSTGDSAYGVFGSNTGSTGIGVAGYSQNWIGVQGVGERLGGYF